MACAVAKLLTWGTLAGQASPVRFKRAESAVVQGADGQGISAIREIVVQFRKGGKRNVVRVRRTNKNKGIAISKSVFLDFIGKGHCGVADRAGRGEMLTAWKKLIRVRPNYSGGTVLLIGLQFSTAKPSVASRRRGETHKATAKARLLEYAPLIIGSQNDSATFTLPLSPAYQLYQANKKNAGGKLVARPTLPSCVSRAAGESFAPLLWDTLNYIFPDRWK